MSAGERLAVAVVGGGLAGLAAAAALARAGRSVAVFEKAATAGGRARSLTRDGFVLNQGPHALYLAGAGRRMLGELGVRSAGGVARGSGGFALRRGQRHTLPAGPLSMLVTGLLPLGAKLEAARLFSSLPALDTTPLQQVSVSDFLLRTKLRPEVRELFAAFIRLTTYADSPERLAPARPSTN